MNTLLQFAHTTGEHAAVATAHTDTINPAYFITAALTTLFMVAVVYVIISVLLSKIFKKAGIESWIAWVPFYNTWKLLELGGQPGYWAILSVIPLIQYAAIVFVFIAMYNIGLKLGKSGAFVLWAIFFPWVWYIWLAVDQSTWNDALGKASIAPEHLTPQTSTAPGVQNPPTPTV